MKKFNILILLLGCAIALSAQNAQSVPDPWVGTWKLDPSQSQFHNPAPQQQTVQVQSVTQGAIQYTISGTDAEGKPVLQSFDGKADGQAYPVSINGLEGGKISYQLVSDHQLVSQGTMLDGSNVSTTITLAPDGKTITLKSHGTSDKGSYDDTIVYVRQPQ
jgi:hypothetical protein